MFWSRKNKSKKDQKTPAKAASKKPATPQSSADIRAQAMANARAARERIGEETLDRIAAAMLKKQQSTIEQAKNRIRDADADRVADEILHMLDE
jgi:predicted transcriptional regulator